MATVKVSEHTDRARKGRPPLQRTRVTYDDKGRLSGDRVSGTQHKTEVSHNNRRASVVPHARNSRNGQQARANAGIRGFDADGKSKGVSSRRLNLGSFGFNPKNPSGYQHVLMGEMIAAFGIIGIRAIADYVPNDDKYDPGSESPTKGASPIVLITATLAVYFVLAFMATRGGWPARVAAAFGLLMIVTLMINSEAELAQVGTWIENIGTNASNQTATSEPSTNLPSSGGNAPTTGPNSNIATSPVAS